MEEIEAGFSRAYYSSAYSLGIGLVNMVIVLIVCLCAYSLGQEDVLAVQLPFVELPVAHSSSPMDPSVTKSL